MHHIATLQHPPNTQYIATQTLNQWKLLHTHNYQPTHGSLPYIVSSPMGTIASFQLPISTRHTTTWANLLWEILHSCNYQPTHVNSILRLTPQNDVSKPYILSLIKTLLNLNFFTLNLVFTLFKCPTSHICYTFPKLTLIMIQTIN